MLVRPIVGTVPSGGIWEQIDNGISGLIVEATAEGLYGGIRRLIEDEPLRRSFREKIKEKNFEGKGEIRKFLEFINNG